MRNSALLAIAIAAGLIATPALAGHIAINAPLPAPVYSWTGFYVGADIGYGWENTSGRLSDPALAIFSGLGSLPTSFAESLKPKGVIGGGQFAYNYQLNPTWVVGLAADFQLSDQGSGTSQSATTTRGGRITLTSSNFATTFDSRISSFGALRVRAGALITPTTLLYGTGGVALGGVNVTGSGAANLIPTTFCHRIHCIPSGGASGAFAFDQSTIQTGWILGGGVEHVFARHWSWWAEYLYLDLGSQSGSVVDSFGGISSWNAKFTDNVVRAGVDYKFGS